MKCTSILDKTQVEDIEIDACPKCGGLWLDQGEIERVSKKMVSEIDRLKRVVAPRGGPPPVPSELTAACPACTGPMKEVLVGQIHIDYCSQCKGIFLDRGELDAALELVKSSGATFMSLVATAISEVPIDVDVG
jgi:Zn-finger nucleic acid-binding protein